MDKEEAEIKAIRSKLDEWLKVEHDFSDLDLWLEEFEGNIACGCDHGCNQRTVKLAAQAAYLLRLLVAGKNSEAQRVSNMDHEAAGIEWWREIRTPISKRINHLLREWPGRYEK